MKKTNIIIPSNKNLSMGFLNSVKETAGDGFEIITTGFDVSAAVNRNYGLNKATSDAVIMIDDDMENFYTGWADGLIEVLKQGVSMVSARLLNEYGEPGTMMSIPLDLSKSVVEVACKALPSSCIAFWRDDTRFDEEYQGAGFEDTDFCYQLNVKYPDNKYLINNEVQLLHKNEKKNYLRNGNNNYYNNQLYFQKKWNVHF